MTSATAEIPSDIACVDPQWLSAVRAEQIASKEIFRVAGGRITQVWNRGYEQGVWA